MVKAQNGYWQIISLANDTTIIKPGLSAGSKWIAGNYASGIDSGRVDSIFYDTFLGLTDSIKSITLYNCTNYAYCFRQMLISKSFGIIRFLEKSLLGLTNPSVGKQNLSGDDIFDFQPGDEYHTVYSNSYADNSGATETNYYVQHNIISSQNNGMFLTVVDSMYKVIQHKNTSWSTGSIITLTTANSATQKDTFIYSQQFISQFNRLSNENIIDSFNCYSGTGQCVNAFVQNVTSGFDTKTTCYYDGCPFGYINDTVCLNECLTDGIPKYFYAKKTGGFFYYPLPNWSGGIGNSYYPVYHKRGAIEEGNPIQFMSILLADKTQNNNDYRVMAYPNPANEFVNFSGIQPDSQIKIYNILGEELMSSNNITVNIEDLRSGFYLFKVVGQVEGDIEGKFIKE